VHTTDSTAAVAHYTTASWLIAGCEALQEADLAKLTCGTNDSEDYTATGTTSSSSAIEWADDDTATSAAGASLSGESPPLEDRIVSLPPEVLCSSSSSTKSSSRGVVTAYDDSILLHNETGLELAVRTSDLPQHELVVPPQAKAALAFEQVC
jgi:hypothetical protein